MNHLAEVQTALHFVGEEQIPQSYDFAYIVFLPLALYSRAMKTRNRILGDVILSAEEVLRHWGEI
jgi:hypothetical protein